MKIAAIKVTPGEEIFGGFFRNTQEQSFFSYSFAHFAPLILMGVVIFLIIKFRKNIKGWKHESNIALVLGMMMIISEMSYFWRLLFTQHGNIMDHLPITICGWACIFSAFALLSKRKFFFEISYFWVFGTSIMALAMPTVINNSGPATYRYYQFWFQHCSLFIAAIYMIFIWEWRPKPISLAKAAIALVVLTVIALAVNFSIEGANYLFIANVDEGNAVLNALPRNIPLKVTIVTAIACTTYFLAYLPWLIIDKKREKERNYKKSTV